MQRPITISSAISEDREWGKATVADRAIRLWANVHTGRVIVQTDEPEPRNVGLAVDIGRDDRPAHMMIHSEQVEWAGPARDDLLRAAVIHFDRVNGSGRGSGAA